jgi:CheY-like chemotaxis protein
MKILIVDDSLVFQNFFKTTLQTFPEVTYLKTASNGKQALAQIKLTNFDLILLDLEMPVMGGLETLQEIKKTDYKGKVIVCSGRTTIDYDAIQMAMHYGADGVTSKSYQRGVSASLSPEDFRNELVPRIFDIYESNFKEHPKQILKHAYDKECIDGILLIHLLEKNYDMLSYEYGDLETGLSKVQSVLEMAKKTNTPLFIDDSPDVLPNIKQIENGVQHYPKELLYNMEGISDHNLSLDWVHPKLENFIKENKIGNLLILGFNRVCCVKNASAQAHKYYGVNVTICDELLFSKKSESLSISDETIHQEHIELFKENYIVLEDLEEVMHGLKKNKDIKKERFDRISETA